MNFSKVLDLITSNNVNPDDIFALVEKVKVSNLKDEKTVSFPFYICCFLALRDPIQHQGGKRPYESSLFVRGGSGFHRFGEIRLRSSGH